jgi:DNA-binding XRE family transcriptional regulator
MMDGFVEIRCIIPNTDLKLIRNFVTRLGGIVELISPESNENPPVLIDDLRPHERLREYRTSRYLSQADVANATKLSQSLLSAIETGTHKITKRTAVRLGKFFQVAPSMFLEKDEK